MQIVLISDTHNKLHQIPLDDFPEADVLIHAGDMCNRGSQYEIESFFIQMNVIKESGKYKHFVGIAGNHDWGFETSRESAISLVPDWYHYLEDSEVIIDGVKFYGSPVQPEFCNWAFNRQRGDELKAYWDKIPDDTDVLITHSPPYSILDLSPHGNEHCGCVDLFNRVHDLQPKIHVFGHIHDCYGHDKVGCTDFYNASSLNEQYQYANKPILVQI